LFAIREPHAARPAITPVKMHANPKHETKDGHPKQNAGSLSQWARRFSWGHFAALASATIAALTASIGDLIAPICRTAKKRRFVLPSMGDDQA
jgi:hypothetical protein